MSTPFDLPTDLKQWDYETVYRLVSGEAYEPGLFDFKDTLKAKGSEEGEREHLRNMRKVIGSMANTITGGFIIFGVLDRSRHPNKTAKERIVGIEDGDLRSDFDKKQKDSIHPHVYFETCPKLIEIRDVKGKGIFVVRIPSSPRRPHMVTIDNVNVFYRRGDGGTAIPMSYYEVRDQMLHTEGCPVSGILDRERRERRHSGKREEIDEPEKAVYARVQGQSSAGKLPTRYHD